MPCLHVQPYNVETVLLHHILFQAKASPRGRIDGITITPPVCNAFIFGPVVDGINLYAIAAATSRPQYVRTSYLVSAV